MSKQELIKRYEKFFGKENTKKMISLSKGLYHDKYIRVNVSKVDLQDIEEFFDENRVLYKRTSIPYCYKIEKSYFNIASSLPALTGEIYIQDIASQIPVSNIDFEKFKGKGKIKILDMAASPGSKTTQLADLFCYHDIEHEIVALEPEQKRLTKLINNIQKQGFRNVEVIQSRGEEFESKETFNLILLDAPCSGNLIGDKNWLEKRDVKGIKMMASLQRQLLKKASELLAADGLLIYSTCSLEPEEDEENIAWAVKELGLKEVESKKILPFRDKMQGFFYSKLLT